MQKRITIFRTLITALIFCLLPLAQAEAQKPVPFRLLGTATWDNLLNAFPPGTGMQFNDGSGRASHLGRFRATGRLLATGAPDMDDNFPVIGWVTLGAANRDQLETFFFGILNLDGTGTAEYQFTGGTGRFKNATGSGLIHATLDVDNGPENVPMVVTWEGVIDY